MTEADAPKLKVGGTLGLHDLYIRRAHDQTVYAHLADHEYCSILTSRQMGKSSLMVRLIARLVEEHSARIASVDMAGDLGTPETADDWYIGLLDKIAFDLDIDTKVKDWWNAEGRGTKNQRLMQFFREEVRATVDAPVVIFLDEIDATLKLPYSDDFFTAIRSMYNQRPAVPEYKALTFCLIGVASPGELIKDRRTTPYNIGHTVELRDFDVTRGDDLGELEEAMSYGPIAGKDIVRAVLAFTGGHPFLTMAVCAVVRAQNATTVGEVEKIVDTLSSQPSDAIRSHLEGITTFLATRLTNEGATFRLYKHVLRRPVKERVTPAHLELRLSGLVKRDGAGFLHRRNRIYDQRFGRAWLDQTKVIKAQLRLQRALVATSVLALAGIGVGIYISRRQRDLTVEELEVLATAKTEAAASKQAFNLCSVINERSTEDQRKLLTPLRDAYRRFWEQRAASIDREAKSLGATGKRDDAVVLAAFAAMKRGSVSSEFKGLYESSNVPWLKTTIRGFKFVRARFMGNDRIASIDKDETIHVVDTNGKVIRAQQVNGLSIALDVCADQSCLFTATNTGLARWSRDLDSSTYLPFEPGSDFGQVNAIAVDTLRSLVAVAGDSGVAQLASIQKQNLKRERSLPHRAKNNRPMPVYSVAFGPDDQLLTAAWDGIRIYGVKDNSEGEHVEIGQTFDISNRNDRTTFVIRALTAEQRKSVGLPAGETEDGMVSVVYDSVAKRRTSWFGFPKDSTLMSSVPFPDGRRILTAGQNKGDGFIVVWEIQPDARGTQVIRRETIGSLITDGELSPDGTSMVTSHADETLRIWTLDARPAQSAPAELWATVQQATGLTVDDSEDVPKTKVGGMTTVVGYDPAFECPRKK